MRLKQKTWRTLRKKGELVTPSGTNGSGLLLQKLCDKEHNNTFKLKTLSQPGVLIPPSE